MAGGLSIQVRQIASYPAEPLAAPDDLVLVQQAGLGGPYASIPAATLVGTALVSAGALGVGLLPAADAGGTVFTSATCLPLGYGLLWNAYNSQGGVRHYWQNGVVGSIGFDVGGNFNFEIGPAGPAGSEVEPAISFLARLSAAGNLSLTGTLAVARDPASAMEVATMGWVGANTVASFNGRRGTVQLTAGDVYSALCLDPCDPFITVSQTNAAICAAIQQLLASYPGVATWNGRLGNVWMNVCDLNIATFGAPPGMPAFMVPTPAAVTADPPPDPTTVVNIAWVENYLGTTAGFATEAWVTQQINAALVNTVTTFNGRSGVVALTGADLIGAGGALTASPNFTGVPTGPTAVSGTSTAQLATTAFVMNTITAISAGVVSFNGRAGIVVMDAADINNAGGALIASPNFTGVPAAPTAAAGTSTAQIATTQFVMNEIAATTAGVSTFNGRSGAVTLNVTDIQDAGGAPLGSPSFTGFPAAPTAANGTNTNQLATTAFVQNSINAISAGVTTWNGRSGAVTLTQNDVTAVGGLVNPSAALTGTPTAPTPAPTDSSTNIATTAFVHAALANASGATVSATPPPSPQTGMQWFNTGATPPQLMVYNGTAFVVSINTSAYAPLASPALTGTPTVPTATAGTSTTQAASTAFVAAAVAAGVAGAVTSFNTRTGAVTLSSADISAAGGLLTAGGTLNPGPLIFGTTASLTWSGNNLTLTGANGVNPIVGTLSINSAALAIASTTTFSGNVFLSGTSGLNVGGNATVTGSSNLGGTTNCFNLTVANAATISAPSWGIAYGITGSGISFAFGASNSLWTNGSNVGNIQLAASDAALKSNFAPVSRDCLAAVNAVALQQFDMETTDGLQHFDVGYIAQQVREVMPDAVPPSEVLGVDLRALCAALIGAVQQLTRKLAALEEKYALA